MTSGTALPPAVIAGAYQTGVLGLRSLQRQGVQAICFDSNPDNPGFRSVYGPARLCPDPDLQDDAWLAFMLELAVDLGGRAALIPSSDKFVTAIARHAAPLQEYFILSPGIALQAALAEKSTQYRLAAGHGMPMPVTATIGSAEDARTFAEAARFPCLVKPDHFREWQRFPPEHPLLGRKIAIVRTPQELVRAYELAAAATPVVIAQEIIQGDDTAKRVYLSCYDARGRRIAHAMFRELRCDPLRFGPATVSEPVSDPEVDRICDGFLRSIGFVGLCEIEMKRDSRDGRPRLIEANPRLSGGGDAAPYAGVDLCWIHYQDLIGRQVAPVAPRDGHFRHIVLRNDACAVPAYLKAGLIGWRDVIRSYRGRRAFYDLDWRDWRYSLETLAISARSFVKGMVGKAPADEFA
ncbi:MAG: ATP-grasp domain-containing protein [Steroidobacteraceae bacterium]|nr:ATP-grasp domain-containing protein [Steroidobacteraceae bacterium]